MKLNWSVTNLVAVSVQVGNIVGLCINTRVRLACKDCSLLSCHQIPFSAFFSFVFSQLISDDRPRLSAKVHYLFTYVHCSYVSLGVSFSNTFSVACVRARRYFPRITLPVSCFRPIAFFPGTFLFFMHFSRTHRLHPALYAYILFHTHTHTRTQPCVHRRNMFVPANIYCTYNGTRNDRVFASFICWLNIHCNAALKLSQFSASESVNHQAFYIIFGFPGTALFFLSFVFDECFHVSFLEFFSYFLGII